MVRLLIELCSANPNVQKVSTICRSSMHICIVIYMYSYVLTHIHTRKPNFFAPLKLRIAVVIKLLGFRKNFCGKVVRH